MNNFGEISEVSSYWFGKTLREIRKDGKDYMHLRDKAIKFHLNHLTSQNKQMSSSPTHSRHSAEIKNQLYQTSAQ